MAASKKKMRVLLIGKGGREHALAWKIRQSLRVEQVFVVPGNGGTAEDLMNVSSIHHPAIDQYELLVKTAQDLRVGLVVVGPDSAIVGGIAEHFRQGECLVLQEPVTVVTSVKQRYHASLLAKQLPRSKDPKLSQRTLCADTAFQRRSTRPLQISTQQKPTSSLSSISSSSKRVVSLRARASLSPTPRQRPSRLSRTS